MASIDSNIIIRGIFIPPNHKNRSWYESTDYSSYNGSKKTSYKSSSHYKGRKTQATIIVEEELEVNKKILNPKSYADYSARKTRAVISKEIQIESEGHITKDGIIQNSDLKDWKDKNPIHSKSPIWDYVISFREDYYKKNKIFYMEDAQRILNKTFDKFALRNGMDPNALQYRAAWHLDKKHHFHMHIEIWQTRESMTNYKTGKQFVRTRGKFKESSFEYWKNLIDLEMQKEKKLFQKYNLARDNVRYKVLGQFNDAAKVSTIIEDAKWVKRRIPKGRFQYNAIRDPLIKKKVDQIVQNLIDNDKDTKFAFKASSELIDCKVDSAKKKLNPKKESRTIKNLETLKKNKNKELWSHICNQVLKRIKNIDTYNTKFNKYNLKQVAIKNKINRNNNLIRKTYKGKDSLTKLLSQLDKSVWEEFKQGQMILKEVELETQQKQFESENTI